MFEAIPALFRRRPIALLCAFFLVLLVGGLIWLIGINGAGTATAMTTTGDNATTSDNNAQSGTQILLGLARDAMHDNRLVAPAGSNAYEFYLSVLQLEPKNQAALEALRESFSRASEEIEGTINHNDLDEARREIDLLREFDSNNFTLALLGGKLAAARAIETRKHEAEAARIQQEQEQEQERQEMKK